MALVAIDGGYFDAVVHAYYDEAGKWVPSSTQVLSLVGLSNYKFINKDVLEAKRALGSDVHDLTATLDIHGDLDPSWISEKAHPRVSAYRDFRRDKMFVPDPHWIERPIIATIFGMKVGITPDRFGKLDGIDAIIELKCVESPLDVWGFQTCLQEMGIYKANRCGRAQRMALQLKDNGRYHIAHHRNHATDQSVAIGALTVVWARLDSGEKVWECI